MNIVIKIDDIQRVALEQTLRDVKNGAPKALRGAINKTLPKGRTFIGRDLRGRVGLNVKAGDLVNARRGRLRVVKARPSGPIFGELQIRGGIWPMHKTGGKPTEVPNQKGVAVADRPQVSAMPFKGRRVTERGWFVQRMKSGHIGIFKRVAGPRSKIKEVFGPHLADIVQQNQVGERAEAFMAREFDKELASQVDRLLQRAKAR